MPLPATPGAFLWRYIKIFKGPISIFIICLISWSINEAAFPYFIKLIVDKTASLDLNAGADKSFWLNFGGIFCGLAALWLVMDSCMRIYDYVYVRFKPEFQARMRQDVFDYVKEHSLKYFIDNFAGSLGTKVKDIPDSVLAIVDHFFWSIIAQFIGFLISVALVMTVHPFFASCMIVWCVWHLFITFYYMKDLIALISVHYESKAKLSGETIDVFNNILSVRLFARTAFETLRLNRSYQADEIVKSKAVSWLQLKINALRGVGGSAFILVVMYNLINGWSQGWLTSGDISLVAMACFTFMGHIWHMTFNMVHMLQEYGTLESALSIIKEPHGVVDAPNAKSIASQSGNIEIQNITFGYTPKQLLFKDLSLKIKAGEKVGLVGFSGSGKTTLVNLILRAYDLNGGAILIDSQDIATVTQESLRAQIGLIPQDPSLFHRTIMDNIRYGNLEASDAEVIECARKAHCHEFISQMKNGYDTVVGERGMQLSGGQRQRLGIARAFLKNAPVLILDEATSALDSITEGYIQESLHTLMEGKTVVVVAHRLSTLASMDRILVFDKGTLLEDGTQDQLLAKKGQFWRLWTHQQEGFLPN